MIAQMRAFFQARMRESGRESEPFDLVAGGSTPGDPGKARDILGPFAEPAAWWDERFRFDQLAKAAAVRARIEQGPRDLQIGRGAEADGVRPRTRQVRVR